jgi:hypothetical protein
MAPAVCPVIVLFVTVTDEDENEYIPPPYGALLREITLPDTVGCALSQAMAPP